LIGKKSFDLEFHEGEIVLELILFISREILFLEYPLGIELRKHDVINIFWL